MAGKVCARLQRLSRSTGCALQEAQQSTEADCYAWCRKGKKGVKQYAVVLAAVDQAGASETFEAKTEDEHHEVQWVDLKELSGLPVDKLQPHLAEVLSEEHKAELQAAFGTPL